MEVVKDEGNREEAEGIGIQSHVLPGDLEKVKVVDREEGKTGELKKTFCIERLYKEEKKDVKDEK